MFEYWNLFKICCLGFEIYLHIIDKCQIQAGFVTVFEVESTTPTWYNSEYSKWKSTVSVKMYANKSQAKKKKKYRKEAIVRKFSMH
jgi:hypothetical protein